MCKHARFDVQVSAAPFAEVSRLAQSLPEAMAAAQQVMDLRIIADEVMLELEGLQLWAFQV
jgi:hypothetical protein